MADPLVDLIDASEATAYLADAGLTAPADLDKVITGVSAAMQSYASRNFVAQDYTVQLNGNGGDRLSLPNYPITAISALAVDGVAVPASTTPPQAGYVFSETQVLLRGWRFCRGVQNVALTYTAGFPPGSAPNQMPADLRRACCEGVAAVVAALGYDDPRAIEIKAGGSALKFASPADYERFCLTPNVTSALDQRQRVHPA